MLDIGKLIPTVYSFEFESSFSSMLDIGKLIPLLMTTRAL